MDDSVLAQLVNQCNSNDVDVRVAAVTKLQSEFESGTEIADIPGVIAALKDCLRNSNHHLSHATLGALLHFLPILGSHSRHINSISPTGSQNGSILRQALISFLTAGGLIDRLGDARENARENARECVVILGGLAFSSGGIPAPGSFKKDGKGAETPLMIFERYLREVGLSSKVWRVREQSITSLVQIRRSQPMFPLRPFLPLLVGALEDTDGTVRECARQSVLELFTGATVTDAARADLKKEMTRKGVRKGIVDGMLAKLHEGGRAGSEVISAPHSDASDNGDAKPKEYLPPSAMLRNRAPSSSSAPRAVSYNLKRPVALEAASSIPARPVSSMGEVPSTPTTDENVQPVYIASARDMESEFTTMLKHFDGKETEYNWAARERSIIRIRGMLQGEAYSMYPDTFLAGLKNGIIEASFKTLASLRTTVASNTTSLYRDLANHLGIHLDPFCDTLYRHLLKMAGFTKRIVATQTQAAVSALIGRTSAQPRTVLPLLLVTIQEKTVAARVFGISHVKQYVDVHGAHSKHAIEVSGGLEHLDKIIRKGLGDVNPGVRDSARSCFWAFNGIWPEQGQVILGSLDSSARMQLEKANIASSSASSSTSRPTPVQKKSSLAAAIAASRAKAKQIQVDPPTLRHQATSTAHSIGAAAMPSHTRRPSSPRIAASSHSISPNASPPITRTVSSPPQTTTRPGPSVPQRSPSASSRSPPPSPTLRYQSHVRSASGLSVGSPPRELRGHQATGSSSLRLRVSNSEPQRLSAPIPPTGEDSLLVASTIPLPDDDVDSDTNTSAPLVPFTTPRKPTKASLTPATDPIPHPTAVVEDALKARAEQAESAADRLLELVEPEDDVRHVSPIPASLLPSMKGSASGIHPQSPPRTALLPQTPLPKKRVPAALYQDSPANGRAPTLLDLLEERKHETGWWLKRKTFVDQGTPLKSDLGNQRQDLHEHIEKLNNGTADIRTLQKLALLSIHNLILDSSSPPSSPMFMPSTPSLANGFAGASHAQLPELWRERGIFDRLVDALVIFITPEKSEELLEYALILLWEMLHHQRPLLEGRESDIFVLLLTVRYCDRPHVLEATNTIRDAIIGKIDPIYGLTTSHASLRAFLSSPPPVFSSQDVKNSTQAYGIIAMAKFIKNFPPEILEEEIPRLRSTLLEGLHDAALSVREASVVALMAAQVVLRDESHLFLLLEGLSQEKKNLLTYLFDKHGLRATAQIGSGDISATDNLEKELRRMDAKTANSPRPSLVR